MGMQVATSITMGSAVPAASQESARGRRVSLPMEQNTDSDRAEAAVSARQRSDSDVNQSTPDLQQINNNFDRRLQFVLDQESSDITVKVIDRQTDTVIKVLPPEELQRLNNGMREAIGVLFDTTI